MKGGSGSWGGACCRQAGTGHWRGRKKFCSSVVGRAEGRPRGERGGPLGRGPGLRSDRSRGRFIRRGSSLHSRTIALVSCAEHGLEGDRRRGQKTRRLANGSVGPRRVAWRRAAGPTSGRGAKGAGVGGGVPLSRGARSSGSLASRRPEGWRCQSPRGQAWLRGSGRFPRKPEFAAPVGRVGRGPCGRLYKWV